MEDENQQTKDRMEASRTMCEAAANIFKIVNEGPVFKVSIPLKPDHTLPYKDSN